MGQLQRRPEQNIRQVLQSQKEVTDYKSLFKLDAIAAHYEVFVMPFYGQSGEAWEEVDSVLFE